LHRPETLRGGSADFPFADPFCPLPLGDALQRIDSYNVDARDGERAGSSRRRQMRALLRVNPLTASRRRNAGLHVNWLAFRRRRSIVRPA
jgi:hypothetical protein